VFEVVLKELGDSLGGGDVEASIHCQLGHLAEQLLMIGCWPVISVTIHSGSHSHAERLLPERVFVPHTNGPGAS